MTVVDVMHEVDDHGGDGSGGGDDREVSVAGMDDSRDDRTVTLADDEKHGGDDCKVDLWRDACIQDKLINITPNKH